MDFSNENIIDHKLYKFYTRRLKICTSGSPCPSATVLPLKNNIYINFHSRNYNTKLWKFLNILYF